MRNITIIKGMGAGQYRIGTVSTRHVEAVLRDEQAVLTVAAPSSVRRITLSLSNLLGAGSIQRMHEPVTTSEGRQHLAHGAGVLREATEWATAVDTA
ncbi:MULTISPECIES: hypothetical protein [unclassified Streptomyces]|uniref:hypothetical protein n=1 Tax=unclassified Streptomyces TaxID=2593676 RepID=UPI0037F91B25